MAYCLMLNHIHLVVVPDRESSLAVAMRRVHGRYAQYLNVRRERSGRLWQNPTSRAPYSPVGGHSLCETEPGASACLHAARGVSLVERGTPELIRQALDNGPSLLFTEHGGRRFGVNSMQPWQIASTTPACATPPTRAGLMARKMRGRQRREWKATWKQRWTALGHVRLSRFGQVFAQQQRWDTSGCPESAPNRRAEAHLDKVSHDTDRTAAEEGLALPCCGPGSSASAGRAGRRRYPGIEI